METCYRHPTRETGVSCSNCGRPICTECMTSTSVGMRCPECARQRTQVRTLGSLGPTAPVVTYALIAINVVVALGGFLSGANVGGGSIGGSPLLRDGWISAPLIDQGDYWRLVTSGFLHFGALHLLLNMYVLYILGPLLETQVGRVRFVLIYAVSLLAGSFGAVLVSPDAATAGASGAIFGLMGATLVLRERLMVDLNAILFTVGLNLVLTVSLGFSFGGHVGGLIGGALTAFVLFELPSRARIPQPAALGLAALVGVAAVAAAIAVSAGSTPMFG